MMETLEIDGSFGEGGGQILRTAIALSIVTGTPIHVTRIRAGRETPGMRTQHVAAAGILRDVSAGRLEGASVGSSEIRFFPGTVMKGSMKVELGTAASITLVLQAVVPAVSMAGASLTLEITGGTDVPWSPTFDYFSTAVREGFHLIGIDFTVGASKRGYYPKGGGRARAEIQPCGRLAGLKAAGPPTSRPVSILSRCGMLPQHVAERQAEAAARALQDGGLRVGVVTSTTEPSDSPGSSIALAEIGKGCIIGSDCLGERGKRAEEVGAQAAQSLLAFESSGSCVDPFLADMLAPLLCFAQEESRIRIPKATQHLITNLHVAGLFTAFEYRLEETQASTTLVINPS